MYGWLPTIAIAARLFALSPTQLLIPPPQTDSIAQSQPDATPDPDPGQQPAPPATPVATPPVAPSRDVQFSIKSFAKNFLSDQKKIWTFPLKVGTGHEILPVLAVSALTTGIVFGVDPTEGKYFRTHASTFDGFNDVFSEHRTTSATLLIPGALCGIGLLTHRSYLAHTGLLALEAWVDVDITSEVMRNVFDRRRPLDVPLNGNYHDTWFKTASSPLHADGSFPSGHTGWGFAVATTIARRYPKDKWVRYLAYGLATVDLASRLTSSNHFASDAVAGAVLGYAMGRFVVLRQ